MNLGPGRCFFASSMESLGCARKAMLICCVALLPIACGCGGGPAGPHGKVHGKVTHQGQPVTAGSVISFIPESGGAAASGTLGADGSYELRSMNGNLVPAGKYKVLVTPPPPPEQSPEEAMKAAMEKAKNKEQGKGPAGDPTIPEKYGNSLQTPASYEVKEGDNEYNLELTD